MLNTFQKTSKDIYDALEQLINRTLFYYNNTLQLLSFIGSQICINCFKIAIIY